jgi:hypothetical protein
VKSKELGDRPGEARALRRLGAVHGDLGSLQRGDRPGPGAPGRCRALSARRPCALPSGRIPRRRRSRAAPCGVRRRDRRPVGPPSRTCQRFARAHATPTLAPPHSPLCDPAFELGQRGVAWWCARVTSWPLPPRTEEARMANEMATATRLRSGDGAKRASTRPSDHERCCTPGCGTAHHQSVGEWNDLGRSRGDRAHRRERGIRPS